MKFFNTKYSIRLLFTLILLVGILIPVIFTNTFFFYKFSETYTNDHQNTITINAKSLSNSLDQYLDKYSIIFDVIAERELWEELTVLNNSMTIEEVNDFYSKITTNDDVGDNVVFAENYRAIVNLITSYESNDSIKTIYIGTPDKYVFTNEIGFGNTVLYGFEGEDFDCTQRPWYTGAINKGDDIYWSTPYIDKDMETTVLSASKAVYSSEGTLIAVMSMDIHIDLFLDKILQFEFDDKYANFIIDDQGNYIFADTEKIGENVQNEKLVNFLDSSDTFIEIDNNTYTKLRNNESDWFIIQSYSQYEVAKDIHELAESIIIFGIIILSLISLITFFSSNIYFKPISILTNHFKRIEEEKDITIKLSDNLSNENNEIGLLFKSVTNMQESVKDSMDQVEYLSYHDLLTEVNNRSFFEKELKLLNTKDNLPLSLVMIDVNGLKLINDAFGHNAGDNLLRITGEILKKNVRSTDVVSRWGGDEFVLLLPKTSLQEAKTIVEKIHNYSSEITFKYGDISLAVGAATKTDPREDMLKVFRLAEEIMYQEKNSVVSSVRSETINTIINTLFEKSPETKDHSMRVSELATLIAESLELPENKVNDIKTIGTIHDIGKIVIDSVLLEKTTPLSDEEFEVIQNHSLIGSRMLSLTHEYTRLASGVLHHHERWDGKGYPNKLKDLQIPLESRIIAVADAFDAMVSPRPYKDSFMTNEQAIAEVVRCSGTQFDPGIVKIFVEKVVSKL